MYILICYIVTILFSLGMQAGLQDYSLLAAVLLQELRTYPELSLEGKSTSFSIVSCRNASTLQLFGYR